jgi:hypothetical protein
MENAKMTMQHRTPWTPEQHRQAAKKLRSHIGYSRAASPERLEQMAQNHETMARVREGQAILARVGGRIADLRKAPSIISDWPEVERPVPAPPARSQQRRKPAAFQLRFPGF